jgi:hypothetical protein
MYSGTTFRSKSGHMVGVHQRIDRIARRRIETHLPHRTSFPTIRQILHFEGNNGPDGIKRKSPGVDEPWHFIDPTRSDDKTLVGMILDHRQNLSEALATGNSERAAFEAAWLSHAVVDGLTPAHHYPLSDKIEELWGAPKETRLTVSQKNIIRGTGKRDTLSKNWEYWGARGVFSTHVLFELGVASSITTHTFKVAASDTTHVDELHEKGLEKLFLDAVHDIYDLGMYEEFWRYGWTAHLATQTRRALIPIIAQTVTLAWLDAVETAGKG